MRISDWSSDVCSSDLCSIQRHDVRLGFAPLARPGRAVEGPHAGHPRGLGPCCSPKAIEAMTDTEVETPSGKGAADENFPVGSWLLPAALRPHVATYYALARAIDDIADNPALAIGRASGRERVCQYV